MPIPSHQTARCLPRCLIGRLLASAGLLCAAAAGGGCLKRTISITSEPPGAMVWLNDQQIGVTPVETDFTFYGTYDVRLDKPGYEPIVTSKHAKAPIKEWPGVDLVTHALPVNFETLIEWHFDLEPVRREVVGDEQAAVELMERAEKFRSTVAPKPGQVAGESDETTE